MVNERHVLCWHVTPQNESDTAVPFCSVGTGVGAAVFVGASVGIAVGTEVGARVPAHLDSEVALPLSHTHA